MISNFNGRRATLLSVALLLAVFTNTFAQRVVNIPTATATELLKTGEAGILRSHLIDELKAKADPTISTAQRITVSGSNRTVTSEVVSQFVTLKNEKVEQITVTFTEAGVTKSINLVQYANDKLGILQGGQLVTYSLATREQDCLNALFGPGSDCKTCETKINTCRNSSRRITKILSCLLQNIDGSCLRCGIDFYAISVCILLPN